MSKFVLSFDVGGTDIKYALVDVDGMVYDANKVKTPYTKESFYDKIVAIILESGKEVECVSFSFPGFIDSDKGYLVRAGALDFMSGEHFTKELEKLTNKRVYVQNDAKCAAISEKINGHAVGVSDYLCVTIGTGIGGAIVCNDKLLIGNNFTASEIGLMRPDYNSDKSFSEVCGIMPLRQIYADKNGLEFDEVTGEMALSDNEIAENFMNALSVQILNLVYTLNPEKVLIGGGISSDEGFVTKLANTIHEKNTVKEIDFKIEACKNLNNAGLIGAAHLAFQKINK